MLSVPCPKCGGTNIFDETKQIPTYCSFCGSHLPNMDTYVQESLKLKVENELLNMEKQRHQMEMEAEEKRLEKEKIVSRKWIANDISDIMAIIFMILLLIAFAAFIIYIKSK